MLPDELDHRLRLEARRRGSSIADVARDALDRQIPPAPGPGALSFFAIGEGKPEDVSEHVDQYVDRVVSRRHSADG